MAGLPEPQIFGKYHLVDKIATGGMAEVFRAKSYGVAGFEKTLVIKKILPNLATDKKFVEMFIDEAKIASTLSHINVVQIFDLGSEDGDYFIAMEYVDGTDLKTLVEKARQARRPVPVNLMAYIVSEVAKGLDYAHRRKDAQRRDMSIVHRDISPHNVLVSHAGEVKITDFGIARASSKVNITRSGVIRGKFAYMSPEQARGDHIDRRSDIFSLGIVVYELVTGTRLFKAKNDIETLKRVQTGPITPPSRLNPEVNPELEAIILKALDRDRDRRYQFSSKMYDDLSSYLFSAGEKMGGSELTTWVHKVLGPQDEADERTTDFDAFVNAIEELGGGKPKETRLTPLSAESIARKRARSASADEPTRLDPKTENSKLGSGASVKSPPSQPAKSVPSRWTPEADPKSQGTGPKPRVDVIEDLGSDVREEDRPSTTRATQAVAIKAPSSGLLAREGRLVGRTDELKRIREILARVARGEGQTLVLTGEDGVGKTRLLVELQTFSRELDVAFYLARARKESSAVPYAALREVLGTIVGVRPGDMEEVARERILRLAQLGLSPAEVHFVGALFGQHFTGSSVEEFRGLERRHAMLGAIEKIVHGLARERPMIIAVDDLENADELTRIALDHIASGLGTEPVLVLVASTEEPKMSLSSTTGRFHRVHLKPLSEFSAAILARSVLDVEDLGSSIANLVQARSGGNPLRVREAIRFLLASGSLKVSRGRVLLDGTPESLFVPATAAMLAGDAIAKLPDSDRRVIAVAASIGERFDERMVAAVAGAEVTVDALARAESAGLVRPDEDEGESGQMESGDPTRQNWRFTHRVFREAAASALPKDQAAALHLAIADQFDRLPPAYRSDVLPSLWNHLAAAGKVEKALDALDRATEMLLIDGGGVELIPAAEAACSLLSDVPLGMDPRKAAGLRCKAWLRLADLLVASSERASTSATATWLERARSSLDRARAAAEASEDLSLLVRVERAFGDEAARRGQPEKAVEYFDRARRLIEDDLDATGTHSSPVRIALQRELVELEVSTARVFHWMTLGRQCSCTR